MHRRMDLSSGGWRGRGGGDNDEDEDVLDDEGSGKGVAADELELVEVKLRSFHIRS